MIFDHMKQVQVFFDLDLFKGKALDEVDFDLIKLAVITQDSSIISFRSFINSATKMILF